MLHEHKHVSLNLQVDDYTNRVLGVIKEKFGLRNKGEALEKFAGIYGAEFVDREVREELVNDVIASCNYHIKKHGFRKRTLEELDKICGL